MDLNLRSSRSSNNLNTNRSRSTLFDAAIEQANIAMRKLTRNREILNLHGEPTSLRSSSTYSSSVFQAPPQFTPKPSPYKPHDNITTSSFGKDPSDFYRKSIISDFQPNFQPKYSNDSVWAVSSDNLQPIALSKKSKESWIKPITKTSLDPAGVQVPHTDRQNTSIMKTDRSKSNIISKAKAQARKLTLISGVYQRSTRASSKSSSRIHSRAATPPPQTEARTAAPADVFSDNMTFTTEENSCVETEPSARSRPKFSLKCPSLMGKKGGNLKSNREMQGQSSRRDRKTTVKGLGGEDKENRASVSREGKNRNKNLETEEDPQENYAMVLKAWKQNRFVNKYSDPALRKIGPGYLKNTISSFSKCKKTGQSMPCHENALDAL